MKAKASRITMAFIFALSAGLVGAVLMSILAGTAAGQTEQNLPPPPPAFGKTGFSGISGDEDYLYVLAGGKLMVYQISDMALLKTAELAESSSGTERSNSGSSNFSPPAPPPPGGGAHGLWARDHFLYVLAGPFIHEYTVPDLTHVSSKELPKPEPPKNRN
ncbi:MAG: hypothetical protein AAGU11_12655 [Syntrophobacteraceae bacterium]